MKKYILFGAGNFGKMALGYYGAENVECFADNNQAKVGQFIQGKPIISFQKMKEIAGAFHIVISSGSIDSMAKQLEENGISEYLLYSPSMQNLSRNLCDYFHTHHINSIALFGIDAYTRVIISLLQKMGLGDRLHYIAVSRAEEVNSNTSLFSYKVCMPPQNNPDVDCFIVSAALNHAALYAQLRQKYKGYLIFNPFRQRAYYDTEEIVFQQSGEAENTEEQWEQIVENDRTRDSVRAYVEAIKDSVPLFEFVEIETINRCNGMCSFCPVNKKIDPRVEAKMSWELFKQIIRQLELLDYDGELALFSNNEPLLDERIVELHRYARGHLPKARMHLFTNGTLLTIPKFEALIPYLDELIIDNYQQELRLIRPSREIKKYVEEHPELRKKVTIVLRKPHEVLTSRGGDAPNRKHLVSYGEDTCALPFQQLIIRPDGKVSLCCNDPLGKCTLGDLTKQSLLDVWYGPQFQMVRMCLAEGRKNWKHCEFCDTFYVY